jgi:hypothetical protein
MSFVARLSPRSSSGVVSQRERYYYARMTDTVRTVRIFLSSPGDVAAEREKAPPAAAGPGDRRVRARARVHRRGELGRPTARAPATAPVR